MRKLALLSTQFLQHVIFFNITTSMLMLLYSDIVIQYLHIVGFENILEII